MGFSPLAGVFSVWWRPCTDSHVMMEVVVLRSNEFASVGFLDYVGSLVIRVYIRGYKEIRHSLPANSKPTTAACARLSTMLEELPVSQDYLKGLAGR